MMRLLQSLVVLVALLNTGLSAQAQMPVPQQARLSKFWQAPYYRTMQAGNLLLQSISKGTSATPVGNGEILLKDFEMQFFRVGDPSQVQITARTPECRVNVDTRIAYSTNRVFVYSPTTNLFMEGRGFFCSQTNSILVISNEVQTRLHRNFLKSSAPSDATNSDDVYSIFSDRLEMQYDSNLVIYSGHVRAWDAQMRLECEQLTTKFATNRFTTNKFTTNSIEQITAERSVTITLPDHGRATGDRAVYVMSDGNVLLELTGHAIWSDGQREGRADKFTYDRANNVLVAEHNVAFKFPNDTLNMTNLLDSAPALPGKAEATNRYSELFAERVTIHLPSTNGPLESILAENNVLITNRFARSQATAQRAFYAKTNEQFVLSEKPVVRLEKGEVRGLVLTLGRTNQTFSARGDARLTLRLAGGSPDAAKRTSPLADLSGTNRYLVVSSRDFDYRTNVATFTENVHAELLQENEISGTLNCNFLTVFLRSNRVETVAARGRVVAEQPPQGQTLKRTLACEALTAELWPGTDWLRSLVAEGGVAAEQIALQSKVTRLNAGFVNATFASVSNRVQRAVAERNVWGEQTQEGVSNAVNAIISGQRAVYTVVSTNEQLELTGTPWAIFTRNTTQVARTNQFGISAPQQVLATEADVLIWDLKTKQSRAKGPLKMVPVTDAEVANWVKIKKNSLLQPQTRPSSSTP